MAMPRSSKLSQYPWVVRKHEAALAGTCFARCAECPGTGGKIVDGRMSCARAGATPVLVTEAQAKACNGKKPPAQVADPPMSGMEAARAVFTSAK
jgi:hypothetical protein